MDPLSSPSFIPKKPLVAETRGGGSGTGGTSLIALIAVLIFITSLVAAGGAFVYQKYLERTIASDTEELAKIKKTYDHDTIDDLLRLNNRIESARKILATHIAESAVFSFLSAKTLEKVQFKTFDLIRDPDGVTKISLSGEADSFSTIALQSDEFGNNKVLHDVVFSSIVISSETGKVTFTVKATVEPTFLLYSQTLGAPVTLPPPVPQTASSTTDTSTPSKPVSASSTPQ